MDFTLPLLETQSAKVFEKTIIGAKELTRLLARSLGNRCEKLEKEDPTPSLRIELELLQTGWNALAAEGTIQKDLPQVSQSKQSWGWRWPVFVPTRLQGGFFEPHRRSGKSRRSPGISSENDMVLGVSVMLQSVNERLKFQLKNEGRSQIKATEEESLTLAPGLAKAARLRVGTGGGSNEALFGTWVQSECMVVHGQESIRIFYVFSEKGGVQKTAFFMGTETCAGLPTAIQAVEFSQFKVGNAVPEPESVESRPGFVPAMELDMTWARTFESMLTQAGVDTANQTRTCGFSDWRLAVKDITGINCGAVDGTFSAPVRGESSRAVFKILENDGQGTVLYIGSGTLFFTRG